MNANQSAYYESSKVLMAYLSGYLCDNVSISEQDIYGGESQLNADSENPLLQAIINGDFTKLMPKHSQELEHAAQKLIRIHSAGSCGLMIHQKENDENSEAEIFIPPKDMRYLELAVQFLQNNFPGYDSEYAQTAISEVYSIINTAENKQAIEKLATKVMESESLSLKRFYIEDTLMAARIKIKKERKNLGFELEVKEGENDASLRKNIPNIDESTESKTKDSDSKRNDLIVDFLKNINSNLSEKEMETCIQFLNNLYKV